MTSVHTPKRVFDVDLFESAAKAAGITLEWWDDGGLLNPGYIVNRENDWVSWDPVANDGDALRLAVKLGLEVHPSPRGCSVLWDVPGGKQVLTVLNKVVGCDSEGSARLAITRAAAEIGRRMKS